jgi:hypothetical protein
MSLVEAQKNLTDLLPCNEGCGGDHENYSWTQTDAEVIVRFPLPPNVTSKQLRIDITTAHLFVGLKAQSQPPLLNGPLYKPIKAEESMWFIEDKSTCVVTLSKTNLQFEEWWPHVCTTERQVDMKTLKPPSKHMRELDDGARATVEKLMFDQHQKRLGLPTSEEQRIQEMVQRAKQKQ